MKVLVITPTIGKAEVLDAVHSVAAQKFVGEIDHLLVVDGVEYADSQIFAEINLPKIVLQKNVGKNGFYGHRVYAAMSHLISEEYDYVIFLDEDNWFTEDHVQICVDAAESGGFDFSYSLRSFYTHSGDFFADDNCASLGKWKIWDNGGHYLVDTNAYCFRRPFIEKHGHLWHRGYAADRVFYETVRDFASHVCTGKRTVAYRLGAPDADKYAEELKFIEESNEYAYKKYGGNYPWEAN